MDLADVEVLGALVDMMRAKGVAALEHQGTKIALGPPPAQQVTMASVQERLAAGMTSDGPQEEVDEDLPEGWPEDEQLAPGDH